MMSMADEPPAYTAIDNIPQPFFPSCFNKYPKALGSFRETNDLFSIASKPNVYTSHPTADYRHTSDGSEGKYYFTGLKYSGGTVSCSAHMAFCHNSDGAHWQRKMSRSDICKAWLLSLDSLFYSEILLTESVRNLIDVNEGAHGDSHSCFVKSRTECYQSVSPKISSRWPTKLGPPSFFLIFLFIDADNLPIHFILKWRPIAEALTIAMHKLYLWEESHYLPIRWTPYEPDQLKGRSTLETFISLHTQTQAQAQAQHNSQNSIHLALDEDSQGCRLPNDDVNNDSDTMPPWIIEASRWVLDEFEDGLLYCEGPEHEFKLAHLGLADQLPSRKLYGFNLVPQWSLHIACTRTMGWMSFYSFCWVLGYLWLLGEW